jgi:hypothetical protein
MVGLLLVAPRKETGAARRKSKAGRLDGVFEGELVPREKV